MKKMMTSFLIVLLAVSCCVAAMGEDDFPVMLFNEMPVLGFMDLPYDEVVDILGEPANPGEASWWGIFAEYPDMTLFFPAETNALANFIVHNPRVFYIDGKRMDLTREELIEVFGHPLHEGEIEPYDGHIMAFQVGDYYLWFALSDPDGRVVSFEIWDTTNEYAGYGV